MSIRKGLARSAGGMPRAAKGAAPHILTLDNPRGWLTGEDAGMSTDLSMKVSAVNRCVEVRSNTMAVLPVYVMNEHTKERLPDHYLGSVLWGRANEAMTSFDYEKLMQVNRDMKGNAIAWIYRNPATGYPRELIPLHTDCVALGTDDAGQLWYVYTNPKTGERTKIHPADVLHYKAFSTDGLWGTSILTRAAQTIATSRSAQQYEKAMYDNGGRPSGVMTVDSDLSGYVKDKDGNETALTKKDYLRAEWNRIHGGPGNAFRMAVLDFGTKYQPIGISNSDAQFVESTEVRVADVCRFFGVPLHLVYAGKQAYESNEQNSLEFVKYTLQGDVTQREQEDTYKLLLPSARGSGLRVKREMKVFLRGDTAAQIAWYKGMREIGAYSVDDVRALEDQGKVPGGDKRSASLNYVPLDLWAELSEIRARSGAASNRGEPNG